MPEKKRFLSNRNYSFRFKEDKAEILNNLFDSLQIDAELSKAEQFSIFLEAANNLSEYKNAFDKNLELSEELEEIKAELAEQTAKVDQLTELNTELSSGDIHKSERIQELKEELETEKAKEPSIVERQVSPVLKKNQILLTLPPFQYQLLSVISYRKELHSHYKKFPKNSGIILSLPPIEHKKELMGIVLQNFFTGCFLDFHSDGIHLPNLIDISSVNDLRLANKILNESLEQKKKELDS